MYELSLKIQSSGAQGNLTTAGDKALRINVCFRMIELEVMLLHKILSIIMSLDVEMLKCFNFVCCATFIFVLNGLKVDVLQQDN